MLSENAEAFATWSCTDRKFQMATTAITRPTTTKAMKPAYRRPRIRKRKFGIPTVHPDACEFGRTNNPGNRHGHPSSRESLFGTHAAPRYNAGHFLIEPSDFSRMSPKPAQDLLILAAVAQGFGARPAAACKALHALPGYLLCGRADVTPLSSRPSPGPAETGPAPSRSGPSRSTRGSP